MTIAYISVAIGWAFLAIRLAFCMKKLKREVSILPEPRQMHIKNKWMGNSIHEIVDLPETVKARHAVLLISSPTCPPCHEALADFLNQNKRLQIPFTCLAEADHVEYYEMFCHDYGEQAEIVPIKKELLKRLGIKRFPTFLVIDNNGIILRDFLLVHYLIKFVEQMSIRVQTGEQDGR
ncbi:hypothetical protein [Brevibacillus sp. NRS-1366]|uniref:hypothetical protein n=1 Tax=Brevibacillus sp. NRS-1366 TaxID=3233899 RepID=UPI003D255B38